MANLKLTGDKIMSKIKIKSTYSIITEESAKEGDYADSGWLDKIGEKFDSAIQATKFLEDKGVIEPSSSCFHKGVWYSTEGQQDFRTGETEIQSFHIKGATIGQERKIYKKLFPQYGDCKKRG